MRVADWPQQSAFHRRCSNSETHCAGLARGDMRRHSRARSASECAGIGAKSAALPNAARSAVAPAARLHILLYGVNLPTPHLFSTSMERFVTRTRTPLIEEGSDMRVHRIVLSLAMATGLRHRRLKMPLFREEYRGTLEQQMACTPDVFRLCGEQIPDVNRIVGCLRQNTAQLSGPCRAVFESNASVPEQAAPRRRTAKRRCPTIQPRTRLRRPIDAGHDLPRPDPRQTSTHSAAVSSAIRDGAMRTALWVEPAAGTTSSNAFSDTSQ